jgi:hypothetical protein
MGSEWIEIVRSTARKLYPEEGTPDIHYIRGWVGHRADLIAMKKRESLASAWNQTPTVQPVAIPIELSRIPNSTITDNKCCIPSYDSGYFRRRLK